MGVSQIAQSLNYSWGREDLELVLNFPWLGASLFGAAVALPALSGLVAGGDPRPARLALVLVLLAAGAVATTLGSSKMIRIGFVATKSGLPLIAPVFAADEVVRKLAEATLDDGEKAAAVAARLNAAGTWTTADPKAGLVTLSPELEEVYEKLDEIDCTMRLSAAPLTEAEKAAVAKPDGDDEGVGIKYCYRATCRSHLVSEGETVTWLVTSHDSNQEGWVGRHTSDILFESVRNPGGFCTRAGELAEAYQG